MVRRLVDILTFIIYIWRGDMKMIDMYLALVMNDMRKYSLQGTTQGNGLTGGVPPVRFSM